MAFFEVFHSKIHRAKVTEADLNYKGSVTIDKALLKASGMFPHMRVQVLNITTGARVETYIIEGKENSGVICLNGAAARHFHPGDLVIIIAYTFLTPNEIEGFTSRTVLVDENNHITEVIEQTIQGYFH